MEDFEAQKYRKDIIVKIRKEPIREKRREILKAAQLSEEYQEAEKLIKRKEELPLWGEFSGGEINEVGEYPEPTSEQKDRFKKRNERMAEIFEGADFEWYLDGAVNVSLYQDKQIRDHKDLDISIFKEDMPKLLEFLLRQGFGVYVHYGENGKELMKRVKVEELATLDSSNLSICKINENGKIERGVNEPFNFVDLHVHDKDAQGNTVINYTGTVLPKEYFIPIKKELSNGKIINLSQPAIVVYHKLHSGRTYDVTDLQRLQPHLKENDFIMLREQLEKELKEAEEKVKERLGKAWDLISVVLKDANDKESIGKQLWMHPDLEKRKSEPMVSEYVSLISQYISEHPDISLEDFISQSVLILKIGEHANKRLEILDNLEKS